MGLFTDGFKLLKKASEPLYKTPKSIQEAIEIMAVAENGIFEVSRNKYSKFYRFQDINYTTATEDEQIGIFERYCKFLNSLDCNYKITINNKNKNMDDLRDKVLITEREDGFNNYHRIYNDIIEEKIIEGRQGIEQERYLTITIERKDFEEAKAQFATLEARIHKAFIELGAEIVPLNGNEGLKVLYDYYHLGDEGSFMVESKKELESVCETVETIGKRNSCTIDTHYLKQREALNTALPIGVRQVETMRTLLTQSLAVLMPFNVQELNDSTGNYYGINQISKNVNIGNRKKLINGNGFVFGVPGSGKSFFCKMEMGSVFLSGDDEIIVIDPIMSDFYDILMVQPEEEAEDIALSLELFVNGSLNIFNHQTNVEVDNRFTVYGIRDLGTELRPITMLVMMESIQNRIVENGKRGKATWLYIDEFHVMLNSEYSAKYLQQLWKKVRKQGGLCTGITQNVVDLLQNYTATTMLANSEFVALLKQANTDSSKMAEVIGVSEAQLRFETNTASGMGLIKCGSVVIPFDNQISKDTDLYKMYKTNIHEKIEMMKKQAEN